MNHSISSSSRISGRKAASRFSWKCSGKGALLMFPGRVARRIARNSHVSFRVRPRSLCDRGRASGPSGTASSPPIGRVVTHNSTPRLCTTQGRAQRTEKAYLFDPVGSREKMVPEEASNLIDNTLINKNFYNVIFKSTNKKTNKSKSVPLAAPSFLERYHMRRRAAPIPDKSAASPSIRSSRSVRPQPSRRSSAQVPACRRERFRPRRSSVT